MNAAYGNSGVACSLQAVNKVPSSVVGQGTRCFVLTSPPVRSPWKPQSTRPPSPTPQTRRSPSHVMSVPWRGGEIRGVSDFTKSDFFHTYLGDLETFSSRFLSEKSQIVLYALQKNQKKKKKKKATNLLASTSTPSARLSGTTAKCSLCYQGAELEVKPAAVPRSVMQKATVMSASGFLPTPAS